MTNRLIFNKEKSIFIKSIFFINLTSLIKSSQSKVKAIVEHFKRSPLASQRLNAMQKQLGDKEVKLKQDVITRWNSTFTMFQAVIDTKNSLMSIITIEYPHIENINNGDIEILTTYLQL